MLFNSQVFLAAFLPISIGAYFLVSGIFRNGIRTRQIVLLIVSWSFYGWWDLRFLPLLVGSITVNWLIAYFFSQFSRRVLISIGVASNLCIIGYFKYRNFFVETLDMFVDWDVPSNPLILPIGISFFTFQKISYLVDLKNKSAPIYTEMCRAGTQNGSKKKENNFWKIKKALNN